LLVDYFISSAFRLLGSYEALEGGELADALIDFTGGFTECLEISRSPTDSCLVAATLEVPSPISFNDGRYSGKLRSNLVTPLWKNAVACDLLYKLLSAHHLQNTLIAAAISTRNVRDQEKETVLGLLIGHAYAVTHFCAVPVVHSSELFSERRALLVRVTNPWGHGTWKGSFAVGSERRLRSGCPFYRFPFRHQVEANRTSSISSLREHVQLIANSCYRNSRTVWMRLYGLPYGRYVVVPTTFYADCFTEFMLRFVGPPPITAL
ncbi:uncharacterized protein DEA37_0009175, partial [Paragonimus westermani]